MELTRMLVEVPIRVQTPPNWLAKESGINTRDGEIPRSFASAMDTGMKIATVAVLMMKADNPAMATHSTSSSLGSDVAASLPR
jgi:hypothetical protein